MSLPRLFRHFRARPTLLQGIGVAIVAGVASSHWLAVSDAGLIGWCAGVAAYLALSMAIAQREEPAAIRRDAKLLDLGTVFISAVTIVAAVVSITGIIFDLGKMGHNAPGLSIALAALTLLLSWFFIQTAFAFHYAHVFYQKPQDQNPKCLTFPGTEEPDYWDFFYFSTVVGMTAHVSDVTTNSPGARRLVLVHGIISFFFNTAILALGVNLTASLAG